MNVSHASKALAIGAALCVVSLAADAAKVQVPVPLSEADAAALQGKTAAVTLHEPPPFIASSPGKAGFAMIGAFAMIAAGNNFVKENGIEDPAVQLRQQLGELLQTHYGLQMRPVDTKPSKDRKPEKIAKSHPEADYVLSVRNLGWQHMYYTTDWNNYWVSHVAYVQLIETGSGRVVLESSCGASTHESQVKPTFSELRANGAKLTKDILASVRWSCVQQLATHILKLPAEKVPAVPAEYADLLARMQPTATAAAGAAPAATPTATPSAPPAPPPAEAPAASGHAETPAASTP
ncbi:MAG: hypothetical protein ACOY82_13535 [Pseudomonadota bacterium]